jgi:hypothetical protein
MVKDRPSGPTSPSCCPVHCVLLSFCAILWTTRTTLALPVRGRKLNNMALEVHGCPTAIPGSRRTSFQGCSEAAGRPAHQPQQAHCSISLSQHQSTDNNQYISLSTSNHSFCAEASVLLISIKLTAAIRVVMPPASRSHEMQPTTCIEN